MRRRFRNPLMPLGWSVVFAASIVAGAMIGLPLVMP